MLLNGCVADINELTGTGEGGVGEYAEHTVVAKLFLLKVLGLVETVGIDEDGLALDVVVLLTDIFQIVPQADGGVRLYLHELACQNRRVVAGITVVHVTTLQVNESDEHGDKHAVLVANGQLVVQAGGNIVGLETLLGQCTEHADGLCHEQRGGNTLSGDVAQTEVQAVVGEQVVVEVATHLLGRSHRAIEVQARPVREHTGQHALLDVSGNAQLTLNTLLGLGGGLQLVVGGLQLGVGILQFFVGCSQTEGGLTLEQGIDDEEGNDQSQGDSHADKPLVRHFSLLFGYLGLLLLGVVDSGQLCGIVFLLVGDGLVQGFADLYGHTDGSITMSGIDVGLELGNVILLHVFYRHVHVVQAYLSVQHTVVARGLIPALGSHQILAGLYLAVASLRVVGLHGQPIDLGGLGGTLHALQSGSPIKQQTGALLVKEQGVIAVTRLVFLQQFRKLLRPMVGLLKLLVVQIGECSGDDADSGTLIMGINGVLADNGAVVLVGAAVVFGSLGGHTHFQLTAGNGGQQVGKVANSVATQFRHLLHSRHGHLQGTLVVAFQQQHV